MSTLTAHRRFYARFIVASAGASDERLVAAFEAVPREDYVGPGPWPVFIGSGYLPTISDDPGLLYQDVLIGLAPERGINNGQPTLHARCLAAVAPAAGETVVHIGAGSGYYTAVLAHLVGPDGRVLAYEIEADLAARARQNLAWAGERVEVMAASASAGPLPACDVIYVNAGATHPPAAWLDALKIGGRLIFPLTPDTGMGCMLRITRLGERSYAATALMRVAFIPCIGARDLAASQSLAAALERQSLGAVRSLHRDSSPDASVWCAGPGWWLSTAEPQH
ncbi:protein-L-isoaspartate O-methyltransferase family protein [Paucibacter sp. XJ19-41]|uniref:protein-L-isoaspartate O-methyltransferase family protein n=1 Tax=Paucibacter sp. XJ19-41 TaxID=2927824 RepID=UPI00234A0980|nr:methyltransferase domain-containing protein [Paucibacter sp. XJ19-41]MDC6168716.1 methyltransferase domain-containing protein [Paucibacter sp. XJ19-41]